MRFHTSHLMLLVALVAVVFGVILHPETLVAVVVPLVGGVFVVLPVLGTIELLTQPGEILPNLGWRGTLLVVAIGIVGCVIAATAGIWIVERFS